MQKFRQGKSFEECELESIFSEVKYGDYEPYEEDYTEDPFPELMCLKTTEWKFSSLPPSPEELAAETRPGYICDRKIPNWREFLHYEKMIAKFEEAIYDAERQRAAFYLRQAGDKPLDPRLFTPEGELYHNFAGTVVDFRGKSREKGKGVVVEELEDKLDLGAAAEGIEVEELFLNPTVEEPDHLLDLDLDAFADLGPTERDCLERRTIREDTPRVTYIVNVSEPVTRLWFSLEEFLSQFESICTEANAHPFLVLYPHQLENGKFIPSPLIYAHVKPEISKNILRSYAIQAKNICMTPVHPLIKNELRIKSDPIIPNGLVFYIKDRYKSNLLDSFERSLEALENARDEIFDQRAEMVEENELPQVEEMEVEVAQTPDRSESSKTAEKIAELERQLTAERERRRVAELESQLVSEKKSSQNPPKKTGAAAKRRARLKRARERKKAEEEKELEKKRKLPIEQRLSPLPKGSVQSQKTFSKVTTPNQRKIPSFISASPNILSSDFSLEPTSLNLDTSSEHEAVGAKEVSLNDSQTNFKPPRKKYPGPHVGKTLYFQVPGGDVKELYDTEGMVYKYYYRPRIERPKVISMRDMEILTRKSSEEWLSSPNLRPSDAEAIRKIRTKFCPPKVMSASERHFFGRSKPVPMQGVEPEVKKKAVVEPELKKKATEIVLNDKASSSSKKAPTSKKVEEDSIKEWLAQESRNLEEFSAALAGKEKSSKSSNKEKSDVSEKGKSSKSSKNKDEEKKESEDPDDPYLLLDYDF